MTALWRVYPLLPPFVLLTLKKSNLTLYRKVKDANAK